MMMKTVCRWCIVTLLVLLGSLPRLAIGEDSFCSDVRPTGGSVGYALRSPHPRCEGMYESPVRGVGLEIVSLLRSPLQFDIERDHALTVLAPGLPDLNDPTVRVKAVALPLKTYYRMDAELPAGGSMQWPIGDVLKPAGLSSDRLGVFGWVSTEEDNIFVPLTITPQGGKAWQTETRTLELIVRSAVDLEQVLWRVSDGDGADPKSLQWQTASSETVYAGQAIRLSIPEGQTGVVRIEISGKRLSSDSWVRLPLRLFRPGEL